MTSCTLHAFQTRFTFHTLLDGNLPVVSHGPVQTAGGSRRQATRRHCGQRTGGRFRRTQVGTWACFKQVVHARAQEPVMSSAPTLS